MRGTTAFLKLTLLVIGIIVFGLCLFWLPPLSREAAIMAPELAFLRFPVLFGLYLTTIPFYNALFQTWKILSLIDNSNAFSETSVNCLKRIELSAFAIIFLYIIGFTMLVVFEAMHPGIALAGLVIIFASSVISFFAIVLQKLLRAALDIKTENEMTI